MKTRGFSTLEVLIAMVILVMALGAVILVSFGTQSTLVDTQTNSEALTKAQALLESAQALARKDYRLVNATSSDSDIYQLKLTVETQPTLYTKNVTAKVTWNTDHMRPQYTTLSALVTNFEGAVGGSTCESNLTGNWASPEIKNIGNTDFGALVGDASGLYPITDIDTHQKRAYVTVNNTSANTKPTFFIFSVGSASTPTLLGSVDNASTVSAGLNAVVVATSSSEHYAYVANAYDANFSTCQAAPYNGPTPANCAQVQVINITDPSLPTVAVNYLIPTSTPPYVIGTGGAGNAVGKSLFYKGGYLYVGLSKTTSGPEFNIIDVHNPATPHWVGSWPGPHTSSGSAVNAIYVHGKYAYLATPSNSEEIVVLDVSNPSNPVKVATFDAPLGSGNGKSIDVVGDTVYLGRTLGGNEFYTVNITDPLHPAALGSLDMGSLSVNGLFIRDWLAFVLNGTNLKLLNIGDPAHPAAYGSLALPAGGTGAALDCEGNTLYVGSNDSGNRGAFSIISP